MKALQMESVSTIALPKRRRTPVVHVKWAGTDVRMGGGCPVVVQSMTNTPTDDVDATTSQVLELARAGSEIVRLTVNTPEAARAVARIRDRLDREGCSVPLVGDFHYNGHKLLKEVPECARALSKYRINPGNVGKGGARDTRFCEMVEVACREEKPVRIGVNWGSLDQELFASMMDSNAKLESPLPPQAVLRNALVESAVGSARRAEEVGLPADRIVLSAKVSGVPDLIRVYEDLAARSSYCLHLGLTEAGMGMKGIVSTTAALAVLLERGIGDTIRVSLTPRAGESRAEEVRVARQILQSLEFRTFVPEVTSCPGCGRTSSDLFQRLAKSTEDYIRSRMPDWSRDCPGVERMKVAVMGCVVNGPGESAHADIGISLPGSGENPVAPVFIDGKRWGVLKGPALDAEFHRILEEYVRRKYGRAQDSRTTD